MCAAMSHISAECMRERAAGCECECMCTSVRYDDMDISFIIYNLLRMTHSVECTESFSAASKRYTNGTAAAAEGKNPALTTTRNVCVCVCAHTFTAKSFKLALSVRASDDVCLSRSCMVYERAFGALLPLACTHTHTRPLVHGARLCL